MSVQFADTMIIHKQDTINKGPNFMLNIVLFTYCIIHVRPASEEGLKIAKTMPKQSLWYTKEAVLATKHFYILEKNKLYFYTNGQSLFTFFASSSQNRKTSTQISFLNRSYTLNCLPGCLKWIINMARIQNKLRFYGCTICKFDKDLPSKKLVFLVIKGKQFWSI